MPGASQQPERMCGLIPTAVLWPMLSAGVDGQWSLTIGKGVTAGHYVVRADAIDDKGKVIAARRSAVRCSCGRRAGSCALVQADPKLASNAVPTPDQDANDTTNPAPSAKSRGCPTIDTATVTRGDSLWRTSQKELRRLCYTLIYQANAILIWYPHFIYPGQESSVMPHTN